MGPLISPTGNIEIFLHSVNPSNQLSIVITGAGGSKHENNIVYTTM